MRYEDLKEFAAEIAEISADIADVDAKMVGYKDVYDLIMSDCDHPRHFHFLLAITDAFNSEERQLLLNGLAREYAGAAGWLDYCEQRTRGNGEAAKLVDFYRDTAG